MWSVGACVRVCVRACGCVCPCGVQNSQDTSDPVSLHVLDVAEFRRFESNRVHKLASHDVDKCLTCRELAQNCGDSRISQNHLQEFRQHRDLRHATRVQSQSLSLHSTVGSSVWSRGLISDLEAVTMWSPLCFKSWSFARFCLVRITNNIIARTSWLQVCETQLPAEISYLEAKI